MKFKNDFCGYAPKEPRQLLLLTFLSTLIQTSPLKMSQILDKGANDCQIINSDAKKFYKIGAW